AAPPPRARPRRAPRRWPRRWRRGAPRRTRAASRREPASDLHPELRVEAHVTLDHVAHVADPRAEHQGPVDAHAEGEPGVALGVDPARGEDVAVDHPAAAPLDPAGALAG